ncbi:hypothetical protein BC829DRAFT_412745 [Chytridium lagenaria]|nr:hypothetical protein BC829DRAFT_412745 [Chytridium lagenaria]
MDQGGRGRGRGGRGRGSRGGGGRGGGNRGGGRGSGDRGGSTSQWRAEGEGDSGGKGRGGGGRGRGVTAVGLAVPQFGLEDEDCGVAFQIRGGDEVANFALKNSELWFQSWSAYDALPWKQLEVLAVALARLPFSSSLNPPPVMECSGLVKSFLEICAEESEEHIIPAVEIALNVVQRLLAFQWENEKQDVLDGLFMILEAAEGILNNQNREHRLLKKKIAAAYEEVDKPWSIRLKPIIDASSGSKRSDSEPSDVIDLIQDSTPLNGALRWRTATVEWLSMLDVFQPFFLPAMKVPGGKGNGVYNSKEEYFETVIRLWVAMTFGEGNNLLNPSCNYKTSGAGSSGAKDCGRAMLPLKEPTISGSLACRSRGCMELVSLACSNKLHDRGLCGVCADKTKRALRGPPGDHASTHIYDGTILKIGYDGKIYFREILSRRPPKAVPIHWRTTSRLQSPNLAGIVKLKHRGASLRLEDRIIWVEIANHGDPKDEFKKLEQGFLAVTLLDASEQLYKLIQDLGLTAGDFIAVIDCQTFAPEHIPVLHALDAQRVRPLPFDDGALLNLCGPSSLSIVQNLSQGDNVKQDQVSSSSSSNLVMSSSVSTAASVRLSMSSLVKTSPPGTGKSYLGVVLVRALLIIRSLWITENPSIAERSEGSFSMIRIGNSQEPELHRYTERNYSYRSVEVYKAKDRLQHIHITIDELSKRLSGKVSQLSAVKFEVLGDTLIQLTDDEAREKHKRLIAAVTIVLQYMSFVKFFLPTNDESAALLKMLETEEFTIGGNELIYEAVRDFLDRDLEDYSGLGIAELVDGIKHYSTNMQRGDVLLRYLSGFKPRPLCSFVSEGEDGTLQDTLRRFAKSISAIMSNRAKEWKSMKLMKSIIVLILLATKSIFRINYFVNIMLALFVWNRRSWPSKLEIPLQEILARYTRCALLLKETIIAKGLPFLNHFIAQSMPRRGARLKKILTGLDISSECTEVFGGKCLALTKESKPCEELRSMGSMFCRDHANYQGPLVKELEEPVAGVKILTARRYIQRQHLSKTRFQWNQLKNTFLQKVMHVWIKFNRVLEVGLETSELKELPKGFDDGDSDYRKLAYGVLNMDELEESDNIQHLRDVYEYNDSGLAEVEKGFANAEDSNAVSDEAPTDQTRPTFVEEEEVSLHDVIPSHWNWDTDIRKRWALCERFAGFCNKMLSKVESVLKRQLEIARQEFCVASVRASAKAYEGRAIIGGTVVGCIKRLDAIRSTNPFAIVVEEASEVFEPLLFACICPTTFKLEMIGDHLQLKPSLMGSLALVEIVLISGGQQGCILRVVDATTHEEKYMRLNA